jgi:hypothetical protein
MMFDDQDAQLQNGAHANKLVGPRSISVAFSSRLSTIDIIRKEKGEVVLSPWEPSWGFSWGGTWRFTTEASV